MATPKIARLGTPDMKPIMVGGPSAMGQAKGGAIEFLLGLVVPGNLTVLTGIQVDCFTGLAEPEALPLGQCGIAKGGVFGKDHVII